MDIDDVKYRICYGSMSDPNFEKYRDVKNTVNKLLNRKIVCLNCNHLFLEKLQNCSHCGAKTTYDDNSEFLQKLIKSDIKSLRKSLPGTSTKTRQDCIKGEIKSTLATSNYYVYIQALENEYLIASYHFTIWDLERLMLASFYLWNSLFCPQLGTLVWKDSVTDGKLRIPNELKNYLDADYLHLYSGFCKDVNTEILILNMDENSKISELTNLKSLNKKIKAKTGLINFDQNYIKSFQKAEWYLFFYKENNLCIVPQKKPLFDIRSAEDLAKLIQLDILAKDYRTKPSLRMWDMDD